MQPKLTTVVTDLIKLTPGNRAEELSLLLFEGLVISPVNRTGSSQGFSLVQNLRKSNNKHQSQ